MSHRRSSRGSGLGCMRAELHSPAYRGYVGIHNSHSSDQFLAPSGPSRLYILSHSGLGNQLAAGPMEVNRADHEFSSQLDNSQLTAGSVISKY